MNTFPRARMRHLLPLLCLLPLSAAAIERPNWSLEDAMNAAHSDTIDHEVQYLLDLAPLLPLDALEARLEEWQSDPALPVPARERRLFEFAHRLRSRVPDPVLWPLLERLSSYQARVLVPAPESRGTLGIPLFDVAAAARGTLNSWLRTTARAGTLRALRNGDLEKALSIALQGHPQQAGGAQDALELAPREAVAQLASLARARMKDEPALAPLLLRAGRRLGDAGLILTVIQHGPGEDAVRAVANLDRLLDRNEAERLWLQLAEDSKTPEAAAAAALARLGTNGKVTVQAEAVLLRQLRHPRLGVAAAQALAHTTRRGVLAELEQALYRSSNDPLLGRRAALALKLNGSGEAMDMLARYERSSESPLATEVSRWLQ